MERYYKGGYYLIKTKPIHFGADINKVVFTCSQCINFSVFNHWCFSWINGTLDEVEKKELELTDEKIKTIQDWAAGRFDNGANVFPDFSMAQEFKQKFFKSRQDIEMYVLCFPELDANLLIDDFSEGKNTTAFNFNNGKFELRNNLLKGVEENSNINEELLGYDFIGVECDGSFHSFYCHDITQALIDEFSLKLNTNGLFDKPEKPDEIRAYLNSAKTGLTSVPWYIVKVKKSNLLVAF